jgi:DNA polymerase-1
MKRIYDAGVDLYSTMAQETFKLSPEYCVDGAYDPTHTYQPRKLMKTGVLAYLYGQSPKSFAMKMHVSDGVAMQFFEGMATAFPGLAPLRDAILHDLRTKGNIAYSETEFGHKRRYPEYRAMYAELQSLEKDGRNRYWRLKALEKKAMSLTDKLTADEEREFALLKAKEARRRELWGKCSAIERAAINHATGQGNGAQTLKKVIIRLKRECKQRGWKYHASIHDEIWCSLPKHDVTPENIALINDIMTNTVKLAVPLKCDTVIANRWMVEYKPDEWDFAACAPKAKETKEVA